MSRAVDGSCRRADRASNRLGSDPRNTNYAGGNASAKGTATDPVTGEDVELLWVKGSGGDLGTLTAAGLAVLRLDRLRALAERLPGRGPRGRDGGGVRLLPARQGRRRAVDRHRDARAGRRPARGPPAPGLGDRAGHRGRRGEADRASASATGWCGCRGGGPASSSAWTSPPSPRPTRRPSACILGGHGITAWGATSDECEARSLEIIRTAERFIDDAREAGSVRPGHPRIRAAARGRAARPRGRAGPGHPRPGLDRPAAGRALHRQRRGARLPGPGRASAAGRAGHLLPGPFPAHQGPPDGARPAAGRAAGRGASPG